MAIHDFIHQYQDEEVQKMGNKDVVSRFLAKLSLQKVTNDQQTKTTDNENQIASKYRIKSPLMRTHPRE